MRWSGPRARHRRVRQERCDPSRRAACISPSTAAHLQGVGRGDRICEYSPKFAWTALAVWSELLMATFCAVFCFGINFQSGVAGTQIEFPELYRS